MATITGARYALVVTTDSEGYVVSTSVLSTPEAVGSIDTGDFTHYGLYEWSGTDVVQTAGDILLDVVVPGEIGVTGASFTVRLARWLVGDDGALLVLIAPADTSVGSLEFDDSEMSDGYLTIRGHYTASTTPSFFLGSGGSGDLPPSDQDFWTRFVNAREII